MSDNDQNVQQVQNYKEERGDDDDGRNVGFARYLQRLDVPTAQRNLRMRRAEQEQRILQNDQQQNEDHQENVSNGGDETMGARVDMNEEEVDMEQPSTANQNEDHRERPSTEEEEGEERRRILDEENDDQEEENEDHGTEERADTDGNDDMEMSSTMLRAEARMERQSTRDYDMDEDMGMMYDRSRYDDMEMSSTMLRAEARMERQSTQAGGENDDRWNDMDENVNWFGQGRGDQEHMEHDLSPIMDVPPNVGDRTAIDEAFDALGLNDPPTPHIDCNDTDGSMIQSSRPSRRENAGEPEGRHMNSEIDVNNRLYEPEEATSAECRRDVLKSLSYYKTVTTNKNKRYLQVTAEKITAQSSENRLTTNKSAPVIIYFNQLYKPKEENVDGSIVARCCLRFPNSQTQTCPGSIICNTRSGEVKLHANCVHDSRRDEISLQIIVRRHAVQMKSGGSSKALNQKSSDLAISFGVSALLWSNEQLRRKVFGKLKMASSNVFPPAFDWGSVKGVKNLLDTSGNYEENGLVILMWKTEGADEHIRTAEVINIDGKFSEIPTGYTQLYCISKKDPLSDSQIPLFFALTNSKTEETYAEIFCRARNEGLRLVQYVYTDFESAAINAARRVWPIASVWGCWRHWKAAILKKLKKLIKKEDYSADFVRLMKGLYALSFAPLHRVDPWFDRLEAQMMVLHVKMPDYFRYLRNTWFGQNAKFGVSLWHCRERAFLRMDYTNNGAEQLFAQYKNIFQHSNYTVLRLAVEKSANWTIQIYNDVNSHRTWLNRRRTDRPALYRNNDFLRVVRQNYVTFAAFNASIHSFMHDSKLFH